MLLVVKNSIANAGDTRDEGSISGSGRSPGEGNGNPLLYSCLENPMDRGAWRATVHRAAELDTTEVSWCTCAHTRVRAHTHTPLCVADLCLINHTFLKPDLKKKSKLVSFLILDGILITVPEGMTVALFHVQNLFWFHEAQCS